MPRLGVVVGAAVFFIAVIAMLSINSQPAHAWTATNDTCQQECLMYRWYWNSDLCYYMLEKMCVVDKKDLAKEIGMALIDLARGEAIGIGKIPTALFCAEWINQCIVPEQNDCAFYCNMPGNQNLYSSDLNVGHPWAGPVSLNGVYYNEDEHNITLHVTNTGMAYAANIQVILEAGHTPNRDRKITTWDTLFQSEIKELAPRSARINTLQLPYDWWNTIQGWQPVSDEFNALRIRVDPNDLIPEQNEGNNEFTYEIDLLPLPSALRIEKLDTLQNSDNLGQQWLTVTAKNQGEEAGAGYLRLYNGTTATGAMLEEKRCALSQDESCVLSHTFFFLGTDGTPCGKRYPFTIRLTDDSADAVVLGEEKIWLDVYSGTIYGRVVDQAGLPYEGATASTQGITATTDDDGYYKLTGIQQMGDVEVTIGAPGVDRVVKQTVHLAYNKDDWRGCMDSLIAHLNETTLESTPGSITLSCSQSGVGDLDNFLSSSRRGYAGVTSSGESIEGILPGNYNFTIVKRGLWAEEFPVTVAAGQDLAVSAPCVAPAIAKPTTRDLLGPARIFLTPPVEGNLYDAAVTKDGTKVFLLSCIAGKEDTVQLSAWSMDGTNLWRKALVGPKSLENMGHISITDDGSRVVYCYEGPEESEAFLLDGKGDLINNISMGKRSADICFISGHGDFIKAGVNLYDAGLHEMEGKDVTGWIENPGGNFIADIIFSEGALSPNLVVGQAGYDVPECKGILCEMTFNKTMVHRFPGSEAGAQLVSYSADRSVVAFVAGPKLQRYDNYQKTWEKGGADASGDADYITFLSMAPAGDYVATGTPHSSATPVQARAADGQDIPLTQKYSGTLRAVRATDRGLIAITTGNKKANIIVFGQLQGEKATSKTAGALADITTPIKSKEKTTEGSVGTSGGSAAGTGAGAEAGQSWWDSLVNWFAGLFGFGKGS